MEIILQLFNMVKSIAQEEKDIYKIYLPFTSGIIYVTKFMPAIVRAIIKTFNVQMSHFPFYSKRKKEENKCLLLELFKLMLNCKLALYIIVSFMVFTAMMKRLETFAFSFA